MKIVQNVVFTLFAIFIGITFRTGRMGLFLHPRMQYFIFGAMIVFTVMAIYGWVQWIKGFGKEKAKRMPNISYLIYVVFFVLIALRPTSMSIEAIENRNVNFAVDEQVIEAVVDSGENDSTDTEESSLNVDNKEVESELTSHSNKITDEINTDDLRENFNVAEKSDVEVENIWSIDENAEYEENAEDSEFADSIRETLDIEKDQTPDELGIEVDDFANTIIGAYEKPDDYLGKDIVLEGFVYKESFYHADMFSLCRMLVTCCTADASVIGMYVETEEAINLEKGQWVRVEGNIDFELIDFEGQEKHYGYVIKDVSITMIEPYIYEYIYYEY